MAEIITQSQVDDETARLLAELETLSDEEAQRLLAQQIREKEA